MEYKFKHSLVVMGQLARDTARTPPSEDDSPLEYVDRSLTILGRTFDAYNQRMRQEFLSQREFTASQFRGVEKKIEEVEKKMDRRFEEVEKKMDRRFEEVEKKIDKQEGEIRDIKVQVENAAAITRNGRLRRMHQPINLIKVLKPTADLNEFVWTSHPQVPKHIKNVYILGQRAKGIFEPSWDKTPNEQKPYAKRRALNIIESLAKFYNVVLYSDEESESDATEVILQDWNVDDCMEALLDEWGMDWQMVLNFGRQHIQPQPQQAGAKRTGNASSREEKKKAREGGQEKVD